MAKYTAIVKTDSGYVSRFVNGRLFYTGDITSAEPFGKGKLNAIVNILTAESVRFEVIDDEVRDIMESERIAAEADDALRTFAEYADAHIRSQMDVNRLAVNICTSCDMEVCALDTDDETETVDHCETYRKTADAIENGTRADYATICSNCNACVGRMLCKTAQTAFANETADATMGCKRYADRVAILDRIAKSRGYLTVAETARQHDNWLDEIILTGGNYNA